MQAPRTPSITQNHYQYIPNKSTAGRMGPNIKQQLKFRCKQRHLVSVGRGGLGGLCCRHSCIHINTRTMAHCIAGIVTPVGTVCKPQEAIGMSMTMPHTNCLVVICCFSPHRTDHAHRQAWHSRPWLQHGSCRTCRWCWVNSLPLNWHLSNPNWMLCRHWTQKSLRWRVAYSVQVGVWCVWCGVCNGMCDGVVVCVMVCNGV